MTSTRLAVYLGFMLAAPPPQGPITDTVGIVRKHVADARDEGLKDLQTFDPNTLTWEDVEHPGQRKGFGGIGIAMVVVPFVTKVLDGIWWWIFYKKLMAAKWYILGGAIACWLMLRGYVRSVARKAALEVVGRA